MLKKMYGRISGLVERKCFYFYFSSEIFLTVFCVLYMLNVCDRISKIISPIVYRTFCILIERERENLEKYLENVSLFHLISERDFRFLGGEFYSICSSYGVACINK